MQRTFHPRGEITLNDLFPLDSLLHIFQKQHRTQITGSRPDRIANKFGFSRVDVQGKAGFLRREVYTAAILLDAVDSGIVPKPDMAAWPRLVAEYLPVVRFTCLVQDVGRRASYYARAREEAGRLFLFPPFTLEQYLTVDEVATHEGVSRETVYARSTVRQKTPQQRATQLAQGLPVYYAVPYVDLHLFLPLEYQVGEPD